MKVKESEIVNCDGKNDASDSLNVRDGPGGYTVVVLRQYIYMFAREEVRVQLNSDLWVIFC